MCPPRARRLVESYEVLVVASRVAVALDGPNGALEGVDGANRPCVALVVGDCDANAVADLMLDVRRHGRHRNAGDMPNGLSWTTT